MLNNIAKTLQAVYIFASIYFISVCKKRKPAPTNLSVSSSIIPGDATEHSPPHNELPLMSAENTDAMPDIAIQMDDQPLSHERDDSNSVQVVFDRTVFPVVVEQVNAVPDDDVSSFVEVRDVEDENSNPKNVTGESDDWMKLQLKKDTSTVILSGGIPVLFHPRRKKG